MDVSALKVNSVSNNVKAYTGAKHKQSFGYKITGKVSSELKSVIQKDEALLTKVVQKYIYMGQNDGEVLNAIVTFLGTAFVAPIFIFYNPFVKDDKETRKYSAWRQPISAVLAIMTQIPINMKFDTWMKRLATTGKLKDSDLTAKPHEKILRKALKMRYGKLSEEQLKSKISKIQSEAFRTELDMLREKVLKGELNITDDMLVSRNMLGDVNELLKKSKYKDATSGMSKKEALSYVIDAEKNLVKQKTVAQTTRIAKVIEHFAKKGMTVEKAIEAATNKLAEFDEKCVFEETKELTVKVANRMTKLYVDVIENLNDIKNLEDAKKLKPFASLGEKVEDRLSMIIKNVRTRQYLASKISDAELILKNNIKTWNIGVSLLTLPVSCCLLNWIYPRLMEVIMPEASQKKKAMAAAELSQHQNKKEVSA